MIHRRGFIPIFGLLTTAPLFSQLNPHDLKPGVAVVILNYNGRNYLEQFLPSVLASTYPNMRVIVADNGSKDESVPFLKASFPSVELLLNRTNLGFAAGYNWALQQVQSEYYVLLNSDVEVSAGWIEPVIAGMEADHSIAACQPKLLSYKQRDSYEYAGACGGWIDALGYPFSRGRIFDVLEKDQGQYNSMQKLFWASGAAMFVRSRVFHEMGGFDGFFFAHQEEIDLCWRMQLAGHSIACCPASVVYHVGAGTLPRGGYKVFLNFRNNLVMLSKNLPVREKIWKIPARWALDAISAWKGLLTGDFSFMAAIVKAHWAWLRWCFSSRRPKKATNIRPMSGLAGVYPGCVVWQHFILGKKTFHEIVERQER
jgi:GT2 family glycosyltransferase